jgi:hypothetical protein
MFKDRNHQKTPLGGSRKNRFERFIIQAPALPGELG